jgi:hypothetical protein
MGEATSMAIIQGQGGAPFRRDCWSSGMVRRLRLQVWKCPEALGHSRGICGADHRPRTSPGAPETEMVTVPGTNTFGADRTFTYHLTIA